jgi:AraC-like DNA-binding protein
MPKLPLDRPVLIEGEDPDEISEQFRGWRIELIHLGHGPIHRSGAMALLDDVRIASVNFERAVILRGTTPKGYTSLFSSSPASPPARVRSRRVGGDVCLILGSEAQADIYLPENCCAVVFSLPLRINGQRVRSPAAGNMPLRGSAEFRSLTSEHRALVSCCMELIDTFRRADLPELVGPKIQHRLRELLLPAIFAFFSQSTLLPPETGERNIRRLAVSRACVYIDVHLREPITLNDLCDTAGVRARTLEYGFREFYEVGPMTYLRSVRLCRVRNELANYKSVRESVTEVARRWRFTHMGQFSRDYRLLFGESPSATLRRSRRLLSRHATLIALHRE